MWYMGVFLVTPVACQCTHRLVMKDGADCEKDVAFRQAETEISMDRQVYKNMKSLLKASLPHWGT